MILQRLLESAALDDEFMSHFRLATPDDAAFILSLRTNPSLNRHLSPTASDLEKQRLWLKAYKNREHSGTEFYFIINHNGRDWGTVRMYDFRDQPWSFCWGSWIVRQPAPKNLGLFSALSVYELAFDVLGFEQSHFDVRHENEKVIRFHSRYGAVRVGETEHDALFVFPREKWPIFRDANDRVLQTHRFFQG